MRALQKGFRRADLGLSTIYRNPTISQLTAAIAAVQDNEKNDRGIMKPVLATYNELTNQIPVPTVISRQESPGDIILTGSTVHNCVS
jgi:hypothetical protein